MKNRSKKTHEIIFHFFHFQHFNTIFRILISNLSSNNRFLYLFSAKNWQEEASTTNMFSIVKQIPNKKCKKNFQQRRSAALVKRKKNKQIIKPKKVIKQTKEKQPTKVVVFKSKRDINLHHVSIMMKNAYNENILIFPSSFLSIFLLLQLHHIK